MLYSTKIDSAVWSQYFCPRHTKDLLSNEPEALRSWTLLMRRGTKAYAECRVNDANIYLSAALEIALLRCRCSSNGLFSGVQSTKPAEFLVQLLLTENEFDRARLLLHRVKTLNARSNSRDIEVLDCFLALQHQLIEVSEKLFYEDKQQSKILRDAKQIH